MKFIPNLITLLRIFIIPWIPYVYLKLNLTWLAFILVTLAALTDFLDGFIARRFHVSSLLGQVLDPFADKLFLVVIVYTLFTAHALPRSFVGAFVGLECVFIAVGGYLWFFDKMLLVKAGPSGKIATALFFLLSILSFTPLPAIYLIPGFYLVLFFKFVSMFAYGNHILRELRNRKIDKTRKKETHRHSEKDPD